MQREIQKNKYISLQEAAQTCPYSQEYLSLRARQGKLRAIKIGRNWATTKLWLSEYIVKAEASKEVYKNGGKKKHVFIQAKLVDPPTNLPIEKNFTEFSPSIKKFSPFSFLKAGLALATLLLFVFGGSAFGQYGVYEIAKEVNEAVQVFGEKADSDGFSVQYDCFNTR